MSVEQALHLILKVSPIKAGDGSPTFKRFPSIDSQSDQLDGAMSPDSQDIQDIWFATNSGSREVLSATIKLSHGVVRVKNFKVCAADCLHCRRQCATAV